jgi:hypothetical protein
MTDQLRDAFAQRAGQVQTSPDALPAIRRRITGHRRQRRMWTILSAGAATAMATVVAVVLGVVLPHQQPSVGGPVTAGGVPVYFVGRADGRSVLYREDEPSRATTVDGRIQAALTDMIAGRARDPDYHSAWPADATVHRVQTGGDTITVDVTVPAALPADPVDAVAQFVRTARAVAAEAGHPELTTVRLGGNGMLWGIDPAQSPVDSLAPVWLVSPAEGDTVGSPVLVRIEAVAPGAVAMLMVWDARGAVVLQRAVRLSADAPARGQAELAVPLPPGRYRVEAYYLSDDGTVAAPDDHVITVTS